MVTAVARSRAHIGVHKPTVCKMNPLNVTLQTPKVRDSLLHHQHNWLGKCQCGPQFLMKPRARCVCTVVLPTCSSQQTEKEFRVLDSADYGLTDIATGELAGDDPEPRRSGGRQKANGLG